MTSFGEIVFNFEGIVLRVFTLLIIIGQIYITVDAFLNRRGLRRQVFASLQLVAGMIWFCLSLDCSYYVDWIETPRKYPTLVNMLYSSPWIVVAVINALMAAALALSVYYGFRDRSRRLSGGAIKETLDLLPVGICFAKADGTVVLKNIQMDTLSTELTGKSLNDAEWFREQLEQLGEPQDKALIVPVTDSKTVMFKKDTVSLNKETYAQITAFDVSEQYQIITELKSKNKKLTDIQARMKMFGAMAEQLAMSEEILKARVTVHDEMGHLLLSGKYYLDNPETADPEKLMQMQSYTHQLLMSEGKDNGDGDPDDIQNAVDIAAAMGVTVNISGELPQSKPLCKNTAQAIRECAANTVKHAGGDVLDVKIRSEKDKIEVTLKGNGSAPRKPITESGGLLMLRRVTEAAGGEMRVSYEPQVTVVLIFNNID